MVNIDESKDTEEGAPPLDESWWAAILEESESRYTSPSKGISRRSSDAVDNNIPQTNTPIDWKEALELYEQDQVVRLEVTGHNRGGLLVEGEKLRGFVPVSHMVNQYEEEVWDEWESVSASFIGRKMKLKIIECDPNQGRIVLSERAALTEPGRRNELLDTLEVGECVQGTITTIADFGVFVDLGGVEGLIHISELSWGRVRHPSDLLSLEQQVEVYVLQVDKERARVALSLKRLCSNPWDSVQTRYYPGMIIEAVITNLVSYGAFASIEDGLDGLIHFSEMGFPDGITDFRELLHEGQRVKVRILQIDPNQQRLGLSLNLDVST